MKRRLLLLLVLAASTAWARAQVQLSVEPSRSAMGDPVRFKIHIEADQGNIQDPVPPAMPDWEVVDSYSSRSRSAQIINGQFTSMTKAEFVFILKPLKKGTLAIPSFRFNVGSEVKATPATSVVVDALPGGAVSRQRLNPAMPQKNPFSNNAPGNPNNDPLANNNPFNRGNVNPGGGAGQPSGPTPPGNPFSANNDPLPDKETFFIRAEPDKTSVFQGELITLSYALYQRQVMRLDEPSISKFPDFKGFLKEELEIPRKFIPVPVQLQGETLYRSELFKYAVFPLKSGQLSIQPMQFKATVFPSQASILNAIMNGNMPPDMGDGIPMEKYSRTLNITSKPLPPVPAGHSFSGAVGQFQIEMKAPVAPVSVDQPFTVVLTIAGAGNVKAIEEPVLDLPKGIETYQTKNQYEFRPDATGFKSFEYLLLPRQAGKVQIPGLNWVYFDPATAQYKVLSTRPIDLNIEGSNAKMAQQKDGNKTPAVPEIFGAWRTGAQTVGSVNNIPTASILGGPIVWGAQLLAYAGAAFMFFKRRREAEMAAYYSDKPWALTEKRISEQKEWDNKELAILIDQWTREKIWDLLHDQSLNTESSRDEFMSTIRAQLHPEFHKNLSALQQVWRELDILRFTGAKSSRTAAKPYIERARRAVDPIVKDLLAGRNIKKRTTI